MTKLKWLALLLLFGVSIRLPLWFAYEPIRLADTGTYLRVASCLSSGDFSGYEGRRAPGYPVLLAFAGLDPGTVWLLQMTAGLLISALLYYITLEITRRAAFATVVGMTYNLNLAQLFYEANLVAETFTTLAIITTTSLLIFVSRPLYEGRRVLGALAVLGLVAGWAALTRPQYIFLPLLVGVIVGLASISVGRGFALAAARSCMASLPGVLMILGWSTFNYVKVDYFALSTFQGINLTNHSVALVETAPERYATIRDILLKYRENKIARTGRHSMTVFEALPELQSTTGLPIPELSKELQKMSIHLFLTNPIRYALGVARAWGDFWLAPNYWRLERLQRESLVSPLKRLWNFEKWTLRLFNAVFLAFAAGLLLSGRLHLRNQWGFQMAGIIAIVLLSSMTQALAEYGENPRYAITVQPLVVLFVLTVAHAHVMEKKFARKE